jgi:hypothetical protein
LSLANNYRSTATAFNSAFVVCPSENSIVSSTRCLSVGKFHSEIKYLSVGKFHSEFNAMSVRRQIPSEFNAMSVRRQSQFNA